MKGMPTLAEMFASAAASADAARLEAQRPPWPLNPFPKGFHPGSTTDRVLQELLRVAPAPLEAGQLRFRCNASRGAVAWATRFLIELGKIEQIHDPRNPCYRRYKAKASRDA